MDNGPKAHWIGMMLGWKMPENFLFACHCMALERGFGFYYFHPKSVNERQGTIAGFVFRDGRWIKDVFPYPDVIYDRYRRKGKDKFGAYAKLATIPMTHTLPEKSFGKLDFYALLSRRAELRSLLLPYMNGKRRGDIPAFIDRHERVIFKSDHRARGRRTVFVTKKEWVYEVDDQTHVHVLNPQEFDVLTAMFAMERFTVQKAIESRTKEGLTYSIRVHLMKNGAGLWCHGMIMPLLSLTPHVNVTNHDHTMRGFADWQLFLTAQFGAIEGAKLDAEVRRQAEAVALALQEELGDGFHEIGLDLGLDASGTLYAFEANIGNVGMILHEFETARHGIAYAAHVAATASQIKGAF
ncbi:YheC/YheD family protein [Paenibacillus methanolicus]|uniref:YheC/D-like protein n=1 Tax=Paenibacillus methanolicus TaxID=582686 RepID=A0A5S5C493_9BACL|nr:YheC/YheD family protein [Paenibacillus methanolicus]TYP74154.1 hypothetical protein BCM02_106436 [Paenibacillus methanolicus]